MQVGDLVMKRDGLVKGSPHYLRLGLILEQKTASVYRVRWADDYGTFWTNQSSLKKVEKPV